MAAAYSLTCLYALSTLLGVRTHKASTSSNKPLIGLCYYYNYSPCIHFHIISTYTFLVVIHTVRLRLISDAELFEINLNKGTFNTPHFKLYMATYDLSVFRKHEFNIQ
jgi:hypothetical protein